MENSDIALKYIQQYNDRNTVEYFSQLKQHWTPIKNLNELLDCIKNNDLLRVADEPAYNNADEFIINSKLHGDYIRWKVSKACVMQVRIENDYFLYIGKEYRDIHKCLYKDLLLDGTWFDGSPCGILSEELL